MLRLALFFFVISLVAALFGYTNIAAGAAEVARILFFVALLIFFILLVFVLIAGRPFW
ncbi:MAG: DUF1328 domain-containing protein [Alphaproteobacteria bacterium]|nr:DUF1328 domain-containing protein [Alphaproteobacteria bacterium]